MKIKPWPWACRPAYRLLVCHRHASPISLPTSANRWISSAPLKFRHSRERRDIAFVSLTALPKRSRFASSSPLPPLRRPLCPVERGRVSMTSILFFQTLSLLPPNPFPNPIIDRRFNGKLKIGPLLTLATPVFDTFQQRICGRGHEAVYKMIWK